MKKVHLHFRHEEFDHLSDRSIRQFMKRVATVVREAELSEIDDFIYSLDLDYALQRSMQDRVRSESQTVSAYDVDLMKKGSLVAWFVAGSALIGVLLRKGIVGAIDDDEKRKWVLKELKRFLKRDWGEKLSETLKDKFLRRELGNGVVVDDVGIEEKGSKFVLGLKLTTIVTDDDRPRRMEDTPKSIRRGIDQELKAIAAKSGKE